MTIRAFATNAARNRPEAQQVDWSEPNVVLPCSHRIQAGAIAP
jgi:hypothetical protein